MHNAVLHGDGEVTIRAGAKERCVEVSVEDEGPGVPLDLRERAFDGMSRAPGARATRGHGLGLAIVRVIVEEHGGTVRIHGGRNGGRNSAPDENPDGGPSAVTIRLPRDSA